VAEDHLIICLGLAHSLAGLGCFGVLQHYLSDIRLKNPRAYVELELAEDHCEAAWRACNWDLSDAILARAGSVERVYQNRQGLLSEIANQSCFGDQQFETRQPTGFTSFVDERQGVGLHACLYRCLRILHKMYALQSDSPNSSQSHSQNRLKKNEADLKTHYASALEQLLKDTRLAILNKTINKHLSLVSFSQTHAGAILVQLQMLAEVEQACTVQLQMLAEVEQAYTLHNASQSSKAASQRHWEARLPLFRDHYAIIEPMAALRSVMLSMEVGSNSDLFARHLKLLMFMARQCRRPAMAHDALWQTDFNPFISLEEKLELRLEGAELLWDSGELEQGILFGEQVATVAKDKLIHSSNMRFQNDKKKLVALLVRARCLLADWQSIALSESPKARTA
jgi:hypothetical protein